MRNNVRNRIMESGTSLLETSMVIMLSAMVVVGGVVRYLNITEEGIKNDEFSVQMLRMVSAIHGVYANGKGADRAGIYAGLNNKIVLNLLYDLRESHIKAAGSPFISTSSSNIALNVNAVYFDKKQKIVVDEGIPSNNFAISALSTDKMGMQKFCLHFLSLNYGGLVEGYGIAYQDSSSGYQFSELVDATKSFSQRTELCKYFRTEQARLSIIFK